MQEIDFYGLKISVFDKEQLEKEIVSTINNNLKKIYFGYSFGYIPLFREFPELYYYPNKYDIMVTDGRLFYLFAKFMGAPLKFDISIPFMSQLIMELASNHRFSMMLIGSSIETNLAATEYIRNKYPNAIVYNGHDGGMFSEEDNELTVEIINKVAPDILFIGVSSPKKEVFATIFKDKLNVKIIVPFGGMIDGLGGKVWLTPLWLKRLGLATVVRVIQEPKRILLLNLWFTYETFCKIIPITIFQVLIKRNKKFTIPSIYGIKKR